MNRAANLNPTEREIAALPQSAGEPLPDVEPLIEDILHRLDPRYWYIPGALLIQAPQPSKENV